MPILGDSFAPIKTTDRIRWYVYPAGPPGEKRCGNKRCQYLLQAVDEYNKKGSLATAINVLHGRDRRRAGTGLEPFS